MKDESESRAAREGGQPGPVLKVIPAAALALVGGLYGEAVICAGCTRAVRPGRACAACGARATVKAVPPPGAGPPPGNPCRRCRTLTVKRTRGLCPRCYTQAARAEDYQFLIAAGVHPDQAAARAGVSRRTIARDLAATARPHGRRAGDAEPQTAWPMTPGRRKPPSRTAPEPSKPDKRKALPIMTQATVPAQQQACTACNGTGTVQKPVCDTDTGTWTNLTETCLECQA